jgi:hypothetical protein
MDVSFYNADFQENIPGDTWQWPDLSSGSRPSATVPWSVSNNNKTSDTVSSDLDPISRINNAGTYVDFSYNVRVPEEYKDDNGNWVSWFPGETHPREYRGSDQQSRVSLNATNNVYGNWMGPWQ